MSLQKIELEAIVMVELSDEDLERASSTEAFSGNSVQTGSCCS